MSSKVTDRNLLFNATCKAVFTALSQTKYRKNLRNISGSLGRWLLDSCPITIERFSWTANSYFRSISGLEVAFWGHYSCYSQSHRHRNYSSMRSSFRVSWRRSLIIEDGRNLVFGKFIDTVEWCVLIDNCVLVWFPWWWIRYAILPGRRSWSSLLIDRIP